MDLVPTDEQQLMIDMAGSFGDERLPLRRLHENDGNPSPQSDASWQELAAMGWLGMRLDESSGGAACSAADEALVFHALGRNLPPPQMLFTAVASGVAAAAGELELASALAEGKVRAALAVQAAGDAKARSLDNRRLFGCAGATIGLVVDGDQARLLALETSQLQPCASLDRSTSMALADLSHAKLLAAIEDPRIAWRGSLLCSALLVGLAQTATDMIVGYAKIRETFGRPIGAYQAVRHPCAEMAARGELARAQLFMAAAGGEDWPNATLLGSTARVLAEHAALANCDDMIQLHGGIGVTDEFDAHLLLKRAVTMRSWFGDRRQHLDDILTPPHRATPATPRGAVENGNGR